MPAKSKKQQRLFGMVHAVQKGEMKAPSKKIRELAKRVDPEDAEEFAETKHDGLPEKVRKKKGLARIRTKIKVARAVEKWAAEPQTFDFSRLLTNILYGGQHPVTTDAVSKLRQLQGRPPKYPQPVKPLGGGRSNAGNNPLATFAGNFGAPNANPTLRRNSSF